MPRTLLVAMIASTLMISALAATGQQDTRPPDAIASGTLLSPADASLAPDGPFGTGSFTTWLGIADFRASTSAMEYTYNKTDGYLNQIGAGGGAYIAPLSLPAGALLQSARLYYYDVATQCGLAFRLCRAGSEGLPPQDNTYTCVHETSTAVALTPGYETLLLSPNLTMRYREDIDSDTIVNDVNWLVAFEFDGTECSSDIGVRGVQLYWKLQISPAPATSSFNDVSTSHFAFQGIEALKSSGVTLGCAKPGGPNYCPDDTVSRAEMALFLARALGLAWNY